MANLELNEKETALLTEILQSTLDELRTERVRTDNRQVHAWFVEREHFVSDLINRLGSQEPMRSSG
jgi:hypothetical protein